jgi:hypothetical protein
MAKGKNNKTSCENINIHQGNKVKESNKVELKPCKGSITRILMDEGFEGYEEHLKIQRLKYEETKKKWREERLNEYCRLSERESDLIPFDVYDYILYNNTPWDSFEMFLNEKENVRKDKMEIYGLIKKEEPEEEKIYLPLFDKYITRKREPSEEEYQEYDNFIDFYPDDEENMEEYSDYEWEEEYEDYESSDEEDDNEYEY